MRPEALHLSDDASRPRPPLLVQSSFDADSEPLRRRKSGVSRAAYLEEKSVLLAEPPFRVGLQDSALQYPCEGCCAIADRQRMSYCAPTHCLTRLLPTP